MKDMPSEEQLEKAARKYCEVLGFDSNDPIEAGQKYNDMGELVPQVYARWVLVMDKIREGLAMKLALNEL